MTIVLCIAVMVICLIRIGANFMAVDARDDAGFSMLGDGVLVILAISVVVANYQG